MRLTDPITLLALVLLVLLSVPADLAGQEKQRKKAPPLSLEGLLEEKLPDASKTTMAAHADNESCYVCHANYKEEELVIRHGQEEISCMECHGKSEDHRNDEDNVTPPDKMYALSDIDNMCGKCHETHDVSARDVLTQWRKRCSEKTDPKTIVCTDCHFQHRLNFRTVWWNKKSGELVVRKKGQRVKKAESGPEANGKSK